MSLLVGDMDDAITLRTSRQIIEQKGHGFSTILQSPQIERQPFGEVSLERAFKHAVHLENRDKGKHRKDDRLCVVCGDWRPLHKFDVYEPGHHLAICRSCAVTSGQKHPMKEGHKQCATCFAVKPFEAFTPDKQMQSGYESRCKVCEAERVAALRGQERQKLIQAGLYRGRGRPPKVAA